MSVVRLVLLSEEHVEDLAGLVDDPGVQRFTRIPVPPPAGFATTWLEIFEQGRRDGTREGFAIVDEADSSFLGAVVAPRIDREKATAELGYALAATARGRGVAAAALRQMTAWAFAELGMERLELLISVDNEKPGVREDTEIWSRLPGDPG